MKKNNTFNLAEELQKLPDQPGVYLMKNDDDEIIYVGKAKILKNRVRQYFQKNKQHSVKVLKMVENIASFEYIVTNLPQYAFSISTIQELYRIRWGIETAFRHLKYAANMVRIHSLKKELLYQEIYAVMK